MQSPTIAMLKSDILSEFSLRLCQANDASHCAPRVHGTRSRATQPGSLVPIDQAPCIDNPGVDSVLQSRTTEEVG